MRIDFANLQKDYQKYKEEIDQAIDSVLKRSNYIMGDDIKKLEKELENYSKAKNCIVCSSGTDALILAMMAIDIKPDDEIITTPFTFIATAETIAFLKAKPVFVDIDEKTYNIDIDKIENSITKKTKAIIVVSLFGQTVDMDRLNSIGKKYNLTIIEDGAQSFGATYKGKKSCNLSTLATTSFFPAKPLGCYGDGGAVFTTDPNLAKKMESLRVHGQTKRYHHKYIGIGGRLDTIQAAILRVKLRYFDKNIELRQNVAKLYDQKLSKLKNIVTPYIMETNSSVYAQYSIRVKDRDKLKQFLQNYNIPTATHYPKPLHLQEAFSYLKHKEGDFPISEMVSKEIMSLPLNPYLNIEEIDYIVEKIEQFYK